MELVERIKQLKAERKHYFDVEGDGVDVLLNDVWNYLESRPTADLGDDGEIVDRVAGWLDKQRVECAPSTLVGVATPVDELEELLIFARQQADRLILYREALENCLKLACDYALNERQARNEIVTQVRAILSGDQKLVGDSRSA